MACHHIFNVRLSLHIPIFEEGMVPKRWLRSYQSNGMFDQAVYSTNGHASVPLALCVGTRSCSCVKSQHKI